MLYSSKGQGRNLGARVDTIEISRTQHLEVPSAYHTIAICENYFIDDVLPPGGEICLQRAGSDEEILSWRGLHDFSHLNGFCFGICQGNVIVIVIVIVMTNITMRNSQCLPA